MAKPIIGERVAEGLETDPLGCSGNVPGQLSARLATNAGEAVVRIAALDEALDHLLFHCAPQPSRYAQLRGVPAAEGST